MDAELTREVLQAQLAERERELTALRAQLQACDRATPNAVIQNAPVATVVTDAEGRITMTNPGETYSGLDLVIRWPDGQERHLLVNTAPIRDAEGHVAGAVGAFEDSTERRQLEASLREARDELERRVQERITELTAANEALRYQAGLLASMSEAVVATDDRYLITVYNHAAEELYGWGSEEAIGRPVVEVFRSEFLDTTPEQARQDLIEYGHWRGEVMVHCRNGRVIYCIGRSMVLKDGAGRITGYVGVYQEITQRKQAESQAQLAAAQREAALEALRATQEQLRAYSRRVVDAVESERRGIARELHDTSGQALSAAQISLGILQRHRDCPESVRLRLEDIKKLIDAIMQDLHRLSSDLRPASLDRSGLHSALKQLLSDFGARSGVETDLEVVNLEERERLPPEIETAAYRIVQESLTNVARHAQAQKVSVVLRCDDHNVQVIVEDDGRGFDVPEALKCGRLGLLGMRERAEMLSGTLEFESSAGAGATLIANIPLSVRNAS